MQISFIRQAAIAATFLLCEAFLPSGAKCQYMKEYSPFSKEQIDSLNKLKVSSDFKTTTYKPGFSYYDDRGIKNTLLKWVKVGTWLGVDTYRWRVKAEYLGGAGISMDR